MREKAIEWWGTLSDEEKVQVAIDCDGFFFGGVYRPIHTLTGREIEILYKKYHNL